MNSWPYYKLKPSRLHLFRWILPAGGSLPVRWVWEWTALFFWLSVLSAALAASCQVVWRLSWSCRRGDTLPWQPAPQVASRQAPLRTRRRGSCRSRCPARRQWHECNRSVRTCINWDALCSSHAISARSAKRIISSDSFIKKLSEDFFFAAGSHLQPKHAYCVVYFHQVSLYCAINQNLTQFLNFLKKKCLDMQKAKRVFSDLHCSFFISTRVSWYWKKSP